MLHTAQFLVLLLSYNTCSLKHSCVTAVNHMLQLPYVLLSQLDFCG